MDELQTRVERLQKDIATLEMLLENITEHSTYIEGELEEKNELMRLYIEQVQVVTGVAAQVEAGNFDPERLSLIAARSDELGQLARVFQGMIKEVATREQKLIKQVQKLKIEIDLAKKEQQVAEITESDYFQEIQAKVRELRRRS